VIRGRRFSSKLTLVNVGLMAWMVIAMASPYLALPVAGFAFQSPPVVETSMPTAVPSMDSPLPTPAAAGVSEPPASEGPSSEDSGVSSEGRDHQIPLAPIEVTPPSDLAVLFRTLALVLGYLWLGCGILILVAIPLFLFWLNRRGRRRQM